MKDRTTTKQTVFEKNLEVRWSDCDANQHMRHSAYSDLAAHTRINFFNKIGLSVKKLQLNNIGPIIFKEQTEYKQEAFSGDSVTITIDAIEPTEFSKSIKIRQSIYSNGKVSALHECTIAWMDLDQRKIIEVPGQVKSYL